MLRNFSTMWGRQYLSGGNVWSPAWRLYVTLFWVEHTVLGWIICFFVVQTADRNDRFLHFRCTEYPLFIKNSSQATLKFLNYKN